MGWIMPLHQEHRFTLLEMALSLKKVTRNAAEATTLK